MYMCSGRGPVFPGAGRRGRAIGRSRDLHSLRPRVRAQAIMGDIEDQIQKLREHVPDDKTDDELRQLIESAGGDEVRRRFTWLRNGPHAPTPSPGFIRALTPHLPPCACARTLQAIIQGKIAEWWEASAGAEEEGGEGTSLCKSCWAGGEMLLLPPWRLTRHPPHPHK